MGTHTHTHQTIKSLVSVTSDHGEIRTIVKAARSPNIAPRSQHEPVWGYRLAGSVREADVQSQPFWLLWCDSVYRMRTFTRCTCRSAWAQFIPGVTIETYMSKKHNQNLRTCSIYIYIHTHTCVCKYVRRRSYKKQECKCGAAYSNM